MSRAGQTPQLRVVIYPRKGEIAVSGYRLFYLNCHGRIRSVVEILAKDDSEAESLAQQQHDGRMELWLLDRLVKELPPSNLNS